jgi:uracil-DNA glycosylase family 4
MKTPTLVELSSLIVNCHKCPLSESRSHPVVGGGNINSKIMIVGEGPGAHEDLSGEAFIGPAGQLLDKMMKYAGIDRNNAFLTNVVKCFPPENRTPRPAEVKACLDYLRMQYLLQHPRLIICLGAVASKAMINPDFSIMRLHGQIQEKKGILFVPTFHPAALLRDPDKKPLAYEDWKTIKKVIEEKGLAR